MKKLLFHRIIHSIKSPAVFLTFDDGPHPEYTPEILEILDSYNIKATFFLVGEKVKKHQTLVRDIADAGHCIGNHGYSHTSMLFKPTGFMDSEIEKTDACIADTIGSKPQLFRPPYGRFGPRLLIRLHQKQKLLVLWNLSSRDYKKSITAHEIEKRLYRAQKGQIVLLHDGHSNTLSLVRII